MADTQTCTNLFFNIICIEPLKINDLFTLSVAIISIFISISTLKSQNKTQKASNLLYVNEIISNSIKDFNDLCITKATSTIFNEDDFKVLYSTMLGNIANSYNSACKFYLDKTIDTKNFDETRKIEIKQLVEKEEFKPIIKDSDRSEHPSLWEVYKKFK